MPRLEAACEAVASGEKASECVPRHGMYMCMPRLEAARGAVKASE